jgi:hypothetical protein
MSISPSTLFPGRSYDIEGTPLEGSDSTIKRDKRMFSNTKYEKNEGGDLKFLFNGMVLYINPNEPGLNIKWGEYGPNPHAPKTRKNRKNRKNTRKNRKNRKY